MKIATESQKETSVSMEEIGTSTQELEKQTQATKETAGIEPPFSYQVFCC